MKCKSCGCDVPSKRVAMGFKQCVNCSTVERYGTVDIVYHKTGNTVQHVSPETAKQINKLATRRGFGSSLGRISAGSSDGASKRKIVKGCSVATIGSPEMYNKVGQDVMLELEYGGYESAIKLIDKSYSQLRINQHQSYKLKQIVNALSGN
jgi:hypothetical protein